MNEIRHEGPPPLPESVRTNLESFRARMRRTKLVEGAFIVLLALAVSYVGVATLDRFVDTSATVRAAVLGASLAVAAIVVPRTLERWYLRHRDLRRVASEITRRDASVGDRLLGVLDLTRDDEEYRRSPELVRAAIRQGEIDLGTRDLTHALPVSRHRRVGALLAAPVLAVLAFTVYSPAAAGNAFARWALPFASIERFTFTRVDGLSSQWVVPIQETRAVSFSLADDTQRRPGEAELRLRHRTARAPLLDGRYVLDVPPLAGDQSALLVVGDVRRTIELMPRERPDVADARAVVHLPTYLEIDESSGRDVRGGSIACVEGSTIEATFELTRSIADARAARTPLSAVDGDATDTDVPADIDGAFVRVAAQTFASMSDAATLSVEWVDELGLEGHAPFRLSVRPRADEPPGVVVSGLERDVVLLDSAVLTFDVISTDDFGVRTVGLEWYESRPYLVEGPGIAGELDEPEPLGDKVIASGEAADDRLEAIATFRPTALGLSSGWYELVAWSTDALPGRERSRSAPVTVQVMTADEHMEWVTAKLDRWTQRAAEVRDREMELLAENRALHDMTNAELAEPGARARLEAQARGERANRARLRGLVGEGRAMIAEASRNPEFGSNAIDDWNQTMERMEELAESQMTSVADLLQQAARVPEEMPESKGGPPGPQPQMVGEDRGSIMSAGEQEEGEEDESEEKPSDVPPTPVIQDQESAFAENEIPDDQKSDDDEGDEEEGSDDPATTPLGLVSTTLGAAAEEEVDEEEYNLDDPNEEEPPSRRKRTLAEAIAEQEKLIEEFNDIAGEFKEVLAALENSTFVRRLKAASRAQEASARDLDVSVRKGFGSIVATADDAVAGGADLVSDRRDVELPKLRSLHGDLDAYFDRLRTKASDDLPKFRRVLDEWNDLRPTILADTLVSDAQQGRPGEARMNADFLADTFDRWGEELVGPGCKGEP